MQGVSILGFNVLSLFKYKSYKDLYMKKVIQTLLMSSISRLKFILLYYNYYNIIYIAINYHSMTYLLRRRSNGGTF